MGANATVIVDEVTLDDAERSVSVNVPQFHPEGHDWEGEPIDDAPYDKVIEVFGDGTIHLWSRDSMKDTGKVLEFNWEQLLKLGALLKNLD